MKGKGIPNLFQAAVIFRAYNDELHPTKPSRIVQKIVFGILAPIGRLLGYQARYEKYSDPEVRGDTTASIPVRRMSKMATIF